MKILVITDLYPINDNEKYTPKTIFNFVKCWKNLGHEVKIIKPNFILNSFIRKKPYYKNGIYGDVENLNYWLPFCGNIKDKIKTTFDFDIIIAHMPSGIIFANKLGVKYTAAVHYSDIEVLTNPLYKFYFKSSLEEGYKNAFKIACRSFILKDKFLKLYPQYSDKSFVIPSGIPEEIIVSKKWEDKKVLKVLTCGQLIKRKNIDKIINASKKFNNIELTVIGSGVEYNSLKKLSKKTIFTGQLSHECVLKKMRDSDIFILPSKNETFGMVYMEAMASGCITVCTKGDGIDGIIKDGINGFLTEPDCVESTIDRIINFQDKNMLLINAYKTASCYTDKIMAENYLKECVI